MSAALWKAMALIAPRMVRNDLRTVLTYITFSILADGSMKAEIALLPAETDRSQQVFCLRDLRLGLGIALAAIQIESVLVVAPPADARLQIDQTTTSAVVAIEDAGRPGPRGFMRTILEYVVKIIHGLFLPEVWGDCFQ